ncbi:MAG: ABC transporter ATP-binding protein [Gammaproteobacteria bacterium]|nr:ABC transporter ATP-binding protein [Gammaproteobacteria bacterium]
MSTQTDDPASAIRTTITVVPRVFAFLWEVSPALLVGLALILAFNALAPAAMAWLSMKVIVNGVVDAATNETGWTPLAVPLIALFAVWVASAALTSFDGIVRRLLQEKTEVLESQKLLRKAGTLDIAFFETPRFYDLLHQAAEHRWRVHDVGNRSLTILRQAVSLLAMVSLLAVLHPAAILVLLASALPSLAMQGRFARQRNAYLDEIVRGARIQQYLHELLTSRHSASEVRVFSLTDHLVGRFLEYAHAQVAVFWNRERRILTADIWLDVLSLAGTAAIWVFAVVEAVGGRISVGDLTLVFTATLQCRAQLDGLVGAIGEIFEGALGAGRYFRFVDLDTGSVAGTLAPRRDHVRRIPKPLVRGLELRDVGFSYPESSKPVLEGLSLTIPHGSKFALVGENGAGKTTIVKLLARLYDPTHGHVELDGHDLRVNGTPQSTY